MGELMGTPLFSVIRMKGLNAMVLPKGEVSRFDKGTTNPAGLTRSWLLWTEVFGKWQGRLHFMVREEGTALSGHPCNARA